MTQEKRPAHWSAQCRRCSSDRHCWSSFPEDIMANIHEQRVIGRWLMTCAVWGRGTSAIYCPCVFDLIRGSLYGCAPCAIIALFTATFATRRLGGASRNADCQIRLCCRSCCGMHICAPAPRVSAHGVALRADVLAICAIQSRPRLRDDAERGVNATICEQSYMTPHAWCSASLWLPGWS